MLDHRNDYDFDVISGPSSQPPARPVVFRPPEPRQRPQGGVAPAAPRPVTEAADAAEEV
jgi:hypothetical protein